jgi:uncharacterized membrane protein YkoI
MLGLAAMSTVLSAALLPGCAGEQTVALSEVPAAVKATLGRETNGGQVTESEKEMKDGKTVYSFDAKVDGKEWDIVIAEDGALISKELEK